MIRYLYNNVLYPALKRIQRVPELEFNKNYWDRHALDPSAREGQFRCMKREDAARYWALAEAHLPRKDICVLDIGCGDGDALEYYRDLMNERFGHAIGIDICETILGLARKRHPDFSFFRVDMLQPPASALPADFPRADFVVCHSLLHSIPRKLLSSFFSAVRTLMKGGGVALFAWWAPYFIDQEWLVPFGPNSHRHRDRAVRRAMGKHFRLLPPASPDPAFKAPRHPSAALRAFRSLLGPFHPRETGVTLGKSIT